ncbi:hypothetical protein STFE110948_02975 [Streptobacillus felis]|uniref:hypothetical protein n=1 Tax=Streptobacillus felis TaxID=1384509 RepID=UPI00082C8F39|nr:hypothetical protein [Streptobacillus felis]
MININFDLFNKENGIKKIKSESIENGEWFIGSAIMAHDIENMNDGFFFYNQATIWSKVINIERINPYWEIYNNIDTFLLKNIENKKLKRFFKNFIDYFINELKIGKEDIVFISSDENLIEFLNENGIKNINKKIDFKIEDETVGSYSKLYYNKNNKYILLLDFTHFNRTNDIYHEVSINNYYLELFDYVKNDVEPIKIKKYIKIYGKNSKKEYLENMDLYRYISIIDTVMFLNNYDIKLSSKYKGHVLKSILKQLVIYSYINNKDINLLSVFLKKDFIDFISKEIHKIENKLMKYINKFDLITLKETYGFDKKIIALKKNEYIKQKININKNDIIYFTDFTFLKEEISFEEFKKSIIKIIERKKK